jgi:hypothetical protein
MSRKYNQVMSHRSFEWTERKGIDDLSELPTTWHYMAYGNGRFVVVGYYPQYELGTSMYSTDGIHWTGPAFFYNFIPYTVSFIEGAFFAVGESNSQDYFGVSSDGENWVEIQAVNN